MADDGKRTEVVCFKATERMLLDLHREATHDERSLSDFLFLMVRRNLYGCIQAQAEAAAQSTK